MLIFQLIRLEEPPGVHVNTDKHSIESYETFSYRFDNFMLQVSVL